MLYLFHHVNFQVTAAVHLTYVARDNFSNTQMSIISDIQLSFAAFQKFLFGRALGQHGGSPRLNKVSFDDFDVRVIHLAGLGISGFSEPSMACSVGGSAVGVGISWAGSGGGS